MPILGLTSRANRRGVGHAFRQPGRGEGHRTSYWAQPIPMSQPKYSCSSSFSARCASCPTSGHLRTPDCFLNEKLLSDDMRHCRTTAAALITENETVVLPSIAYHQPVTRVALADIIGREARRDVIGRRRELDFIAFRATVAAATRTVLLCHDEAVPGASRARYASRTAGLRGTRGRGVVVEG